jgi:Collagen triple helix repeat (20 copies)
MMRAFVKNLPSFLAHFLPGHPPAVSSTKFSSMNTLSSRAVGLALFLLAVSFAVTRAGAVEALLLQDTYVDNGTTGGHPANGSNYGSEIDLRVSKTNGRLCRTFLKFSLATLPPGTLASDVSHARLRLWVNSNSTATGAITLSPVTAAWDEYVLKDTLTGSLTFGAPKLTDLPVTSLNNFISVDVTAWVKAWLSGTVANEGIEIEPSATATTLNLAFDSKESNQTSHEPRLEISLSRVGLTGPAGPVGPIGPQGIAGPVGPVGANGALGPVGPAGPSGSTGPQGIAGNDGTKWFSFSGPPAADLGALSNYYLNLANGDVWQKVSSEGGPVWTLQGNIRGAVGANGIDGVAGSAGPTGPQGPAGIPGPTGPSGPAGPPGETGSQGPAGPSGPAAVWPTRIAPQGDLAMGDFTQGFPP